MLSLAVICIIKGVDPPSHPVLLGVNDCETSWGGIPGQHCNWCTTGVISPEMDKSQFFELYKK